jgi:hypothetical protein
MVDKKRRLSEAEQWYFRLMNDPNQFEKERHIDSIKVYNSIIEEFQKLYEKTPPADRIARVKILNGMKQSKNDLTKISSRIRDQEIQDENCNKQIRSIMKYQKTK